jgi:hypothetical protein
VTPAQGIGCELLNVSSQPRSQSEEQRLELIQVFLFHAEVPDRFRTGFEMQSLIIGMPWCEIKSPPAGLDRLMRPP